MGLKPLIGSGDKIGMFTLPFFLIGLTFNIIFPSFFAVGGPAPILKTVSIVILIIGIIVWAWSVTLILINVPKKKLITNGPYSLVKHPLYTGVALFVLPWAGFLFNTWLGVLTGIVLYIGSKRFSSQEETVLSGNFGTAWSEYCNNVRFPQI